MKNEGKIEYAQWGVDLREGGLLIAEDAHFINNKISVRFLNYPDFSNLSSLTDCEFAVNDDFSNFNSNGLPIFISHGVLSLVKGISFSNCTFSDIRTLGGDLLKRGKAIDSWHSRFAVGGSSFDGFKNAIAAYEGFGPDISTYTIRGCTFDNNLYGVYNFGVNLFKIINNNTFNIGGYPDDGNQLRHTGIFIDTGSGFDIEENHFNGQIGNNLMETIGIVAFNTGTEANDISENHYDHLNRANQAERINRDFIEPDVGLQYWCNQNLGNNLIDFFVGEQGSIGADQGNQQATKNTFSGNQDHPVEDFYNQGPNLTYHFRNIQNEIPNPNFVLNTTLVPVTAVIMCPSEEDGGNNGGGGGDGFGDKPLDDTERQKVLKDFQDAKTNFIDQSNQLDALLDGQDADGLLSTIQNATTATANQVQSQLNTIAPYLSYEAMEAYLNRTDIFNLSQMEAVLIANPDVFRKQYSVHQLTNLYPDGLPQNLNNALLNITERTNIERTLALHRTNLMKYINILIRDEVLQEDLDVDDFRAWLNEKNSLEADYEIVASWLSEYDFSTANQLLNTIPTEYTLNIQQANEYSNYVTLAQLQNDIWQDNRTIFELNEMELNTLVSIAENGTGVATSKIRGLLNFAYDYNYYRIPQNPNGEDAQGIIKPNLSPYQNQFKNKLSVYPNPAKAEVNFKYKIEEEQIANTYIRITNLDGKEVQIIPLTNPSGTVKWDTDTTESGIYLYQIISNNSKSEIGKVVLIK